MTREEAIQWLQRIENTYIHGGDEAFDESRKEALHMAIEALKQVTGKLNNPDDSLLTADPEACKKQKSKLDLIGRQDAIEAVRLESAKRLALTRGDILDILYALPSADRPRGEWIEEEEYGDLWACDQCGFASEHNDNFCPNCGADMRPTERSEE